MTSRRSQRNSSKETFNTRAHKTMAGGCIVYTAPPSPVVGVGLPRSTAASRMKSAQSQYDNKTSWPERQLFHRYRHVYAGKGGWYGCRCTSQSRVRDSSNTRGCSRCSISSAVTPTLSDSASFDVSAPAGGSTDGCPRITNTFLLQGRRLRVVQDQNRRRATWRMSTTIKKEPAPKTCAVTEREEVSKPRRKYDLILPTVTCDTWSAGSSPEHQHQNTPQSFHNDLGLEEAESERKDVGRTKEDVESNRGREQVHESQVSEVQELMNQLHPVSDNAGGNVSKTEQLPSVRNPKYFVFDLCVPFAQQQAHARGEKFVMESGEPNGMNKTNNGSLGQFCCGGGGGGKPVGTMSSEAQQVVMEARLEKTTTKHLTPSDADDLCQPETHGSLVCRPATSRGTGSRVEKPRNSDHYPNFYSAVVFT